MFRNYEDDYLNATKHAQVNTHDNAQSSNMKLIIFNFLLVLVLAVVTFFYLKSNTTLFSDFFAKKQAVLGVSETVDDVELSDEELMKILRVTDQEDTNELALRNSMKVLVNESSIKSQSSYTEAIARELDDKSGFKGRIVVVKQGDTLSSLSQKFYGNSQEFSKIIESNDDLSENSYLLKVGQTIKIPF